MYAIVFRLETTFGGANTSPGRKAPDAPFLHPVKDASLQVGCKNVAIWEKYNRSFLKMSKTWFSPHLFTGQPQ